MGEVATVCGGVVEVDLDGGGEGGLVGAGAELVAVVVEGGVSDL